MSELRKKLDRAKTEYEQLRYPGDLAGDVLPATAGRIWPMMATLAAIAVAAVVAMAIWLNVPSHSGTKSLAVGKPSVHLGAATSEAVANNTTEEVTTDYPDGVTVVPTMESMGLSQVPSMPSFDDLMSSQAATTQEAS
jgi:hypothetical protein